MPPAYSRALQNAGVDAWFGHVWTAWGQDSVAAFAPFLMDPRIELTKAGAPGLPFAPPDVIEVMTDWLAAFEFDTPPSILDPAAGAGALVASLVRKLLTEAEYSADEMIAKLVLVDTDRERLDIACVVIARAFERSSAETPAIVLERIRAASSVANARQWNSSAERQFDLVVAVSPLGTGEGGAAGAKGDEGSALFLDILTNRVVNDGVGTMLVPASVVTSISGVMAEARDRLLERFGTVKLLNYDHSPESLLSSSDEVPRTIIHVHAAGSGEVTTTPILRWSPERRRIALTDPPQTTLHQPPPLGSHSFVPRIGSDAERRLVDAVFAHASQRWDLVGVERVHGDYRSGDDLFTVGLTVRDRFSIALNSPRMYVGEAPTGGARFAVTPRDPELGDPALAVMLSRTALWWWTATGDGRLVRIEHITEPLSWLRLLEPDELQLAASIAKAWRGSAVPADGSRVGASTSDPAERARLVTALEGALLARLGMSEADSHAFRSRASFVNV